MDCTTRLQRAVNQVPFCQWTPNQVGSSAPFLERKWTFHDCGRSTLTSSCHGFEGGAAGGGGRRPYSLVCRDRISGAKVDDCHCLPLQSFSRLRSAGFSFRKRSAVLIVFSNALTSVVRGLSPLTFTLFAEQVVVASVSAFRCIADWKG